MRNSAYTLLNHYIHNKYILTLLSLLGLLLGLLFIITLNTRLSTSNRIKATNGIQYTYSCDSNFYYSTNRSCSGSPKQTYKSLQPRDNNINPENELCTNDRLEPLDFNYTNCVFIGMAITTCDDSNICVIHTITPTPQFAATATLPPNVTGPTKPPTITITGPTKPPPTPTKKPIATAVPSKAPTPGPGGGCGISCDSTKPCQSGFSCMDVGTDGNVCWNEGICGGPDTRSRIEGVVRGCSNEPMANVKVFAWGNTTTTDSTGKFRITKGITDVFNVTINETSVLAGADATKNAADGYFMRNYDNLKLNTAPDPMQSCAKVNCLFKTKTTDSLPIPFSNKLYNGGPERYAYRIQKPMTDTFYKQNFVSTTSYAKSFDFKKIDCAVPTLTPPPIPTASPNACNALCVTDNQCSTLNPNWYCATQFSYYGWLNTSNNIKTITYSSADGNKTDSGATTDLNVFLDNGVLKQHMVKSGKIYYRDDGGGKGLGPIWKNVTADINYMFTSCPKVGPCNQKITGFNFYKTKSGVLTQHLTVDTGTNSQLYSRTFNQNAWTSWTNVTVNVANVGGANAGKISSFTSYVNRDGYTYQTLVRGGRVFERHDLNGWGAWFELTNTINGCEGGDLFYGCGLDADTILAYERTVRADNSEIYHLIRAGNKSYSLSGAEKEQRCRVKSNIYNVSCTP